MGAVYLYSWTEKRLNWLLTSTHATAQDTRGGSPDESQGDIMEAAGTLSDACDAVGTAR